MVKQRLPILPIFSHTKEVTISGRDTSKFAIIALLTNMFLLYNIVVEIPKVILYVKGSGKEVSQILLHN